MLRRQSSDGAGNAQAAPVDPELGRKNREMRAAVDNVVNSRVKPGRFVSPDFIIQTREFSTDRLTCVQLARDDVNRERVLRGNCGEVPARFFSPTSANRQASTVYSVTLEN